MRRTPPRLFQAANVDYAHCSRTPDEGEGGEAQTVCECLVVKYERASSVMDGV